MMSNVEYKFKKGDIVECMSTNGRGPIVHRATWHSVQPAYTYKDQSMRLEG